MLVLGQCQSTINNVKKPQDLIGLKQQTKVAIGTASCENFKVAEQMNCSPTQIGLIANLSLQACTQSDGTIASYTELLYEPINDAGLSLIVWINDFSIDFSVCIQGCTCQYSIGIFFPFSLFPFLSLFFSFFSFFPIFTFFLKMKEKQK